MVSNTQVMVNLPRNHMVNPSEFSSHRNELQLKKRETNIFKSMTE